MSERYVRCGPFGHGVYTEVPTHAFREHPPFALMWAGYDLREQYWLCHCGTIVSDHLRVAAAGRPCDGTVRCAICNARLMRQQGRELLHESRWAGVICPQCRDALKEVLTVPPAPGAVMP